MKKTININLGGQPFIIDEQAYDILHRYFEALKQKFTNESEQKEILSDIEARVAEVFAQQLGKTRAVINEEDVVYIMSLMGKPEDIAGEAESNSTGQDTKGANSSSTSYTGPAEKKFFRDPDNKKVGGVISGLAHYFGWGDPTWIRIAIVAAIVLSMFAHMGLGVPLVIIYIILLIVVPMASTSAEKLQMRGQPVTIQNIEKEVRDAMTTAGQSINSMVKDNNAVGKVSGAAMSIGRALAKIILVFVLMICILLMLALAGSFFGLSILSSASLSEVTRLVVSNRHTIMLINIGLLLAIGIPLISIMYDAIRYLTDSKVKNPVFKRTLWFIWFVGIILLSISAWTVAKNFTAVDTVNQKVQLLSPRGGTLRVQLADTMGNVIALRNSDDQEFSTFIHIDGMSKTDYGFAFSDINLEVAVSPDSNFYVEKVTTSRGASFADADKNIQMMRYKFSQTDTTLNLDDKFELPKEGKWRGQKIKIRIYVPEGKNITFADNMDQMEASVKGNDYFDDGMISGKTLHVENGKVKCPDCKEKVINDDDKDDDSKGNGRSHVSVQTNGSNQLNNPSVNINQNGVSVVGTNEKGEKIKVKVDDQGVKVTTVDTTGKTTVNKKQ
jgi:phage shock protein PspC (stress-responsive transcriptional regulator)